MKYPMASTNTSRPPALTPGRLNGKVTRQKVRSRPAPRPWAARITFGSIEASEA